MKTLQRAVTAFIAGALSVAGLAQAADYSAWTGSRNIVLNTAAAGANVSQNVVKFPVLVRLTQNEANIISAAKAGGADIRFSKSDGTTPLPYQIDAWEPWGASIWVLVDTVYGNNSTQSIRMYWGNAAAVSESNGSAVFDTANGFVGVWHLGNAVGASPRPNSVAGAPTAQFRNAPPTQQPVRGIIGMADSLTGGQGTNDGTGDEAGLGLYLDMGRTPYAGYSDFTGGIHYSIWVNPNANYGGFMRFLQMVDDTTYNAANSSASRIMFLHHTANDGSLAIRTSGLNSGNGNSVTFANHTGVWKQLAFTKGPGTDSVRIFVDGVPFHTFTAIDDIPVSVRTYVSIGRSFDPSNAYLNAKIDAPTLSKRNRSAAWIKLSYENQKQANTLVNIGLGGDVTSTPYSAWSGHRTITLNTKASGANVAGDVYNFPLLVRLTTAEALIIAASKAGGADIRFSKTDNGPSLAYAIDSWDSAGAAIWVKMDTIKGNDSLQSIRMHWGNPAATDSSRTAAVFDTANGYIGVWHLGNPAGNPQTAARPNAAGVSANDATPQYPDAHPGPVVKGLIGMADTLRGQGQSANGDHLHLGVIPATNFPNGLTMSMWVKPSSYSVGTEAVDRWIQFYTIGNRTAGTPSATCPPCAGTGNGSNSVWFGRTGAGGADNILGAEALSGTTTGTRRDGPAGSATPGQWMHLALALQGTGNGSLNLYRNGTQILTNTNNSAALQSVERNANFIGRATWNDYTLAGVVDEARLSKVRRSADWIKLSYESQKAGNSLTNIGTYVPPVPPGPPTSVMVAGNGIIGEAVVSWSAPASNGGATITDYTVTSAPGGLTCMSTFPQATCTVTGLTVGTSYTFTVVATNPAGTGPASAPSGAFVVSILPGSLIARTNGLNPYTYRLPAAVAAVTERLTMTIVDVNGKRVWSRTVNPSAGAAEVTWDGRNAAGLKVSGGMYIVRISLRTGGKTVESEYKGVTLKP